VVTAPAAGGNWLEHDMRPVELARDACRTCDAPPVKGPASHFPSIEKKYGRPVQEWLDMIRTKPDQKHMELVTWLKAEHGLGHGHANALVAYALADAKRG